MVLNGEHTVVEGLDIYAQVGRGSAHDEIIPFSVKDGLLRLGTEKSKIEGNKISLEFLKVSNLCIGKNMVFNLYPLLLK